MADDGPGIDAALREVALMEGDEEAAARHALVAERYYRRALSIDDLFGAVENSGR